jgi:nicotinamide-nucleotide amidase
MAQEPLNTDLDDAGLAHLADELGRRLHGAGRFLTTAESCSGGWIAKCVTDIAGSSAWLDRGFVTYSNDAKRDMLGVSSRTLAEHGAVSEPVVREMALGALANSRADLAVAVSGIAGPGGGSDEKPVGTVCFAFAAPGDVRCETLCFDGDREAVRRRTVAHALRRLIGLLPHAR